MKLGTLGILPLLSLLISCGGGSGAAEGGTSYVRPGEVASRVGCQASFSMQTTREIFARELGRCTVAGSEVSI